MFSGGSQKESEAKRNGERNLRRLQCRAVPENKSTQPAKLNGISTKAPKRNRDETIPPRRKSTSDEKGQAEASTKGKGATVFSPDVEPLSYPELGAIIIMIIMILVITIMIVIKIRMIIMIIIIIIILTIIVVVVIIIIIRIVIVIDWGSGARVPMRRAARNRGDPRLSRGQTKGS